MTMQCTCYVLNMFMLLRHTQCAVAMPRKHVLLCCAMKYESAGDQGKAVSAMHLCYHPEHAAW